MHSLPKIAPTSRIIGYARVSTTEQDLRMQVDALRKAGVLDVNLYTDQRSGKTMKRPGLEAALMDCRPGDVLLVWKLDRLARSIEDLIYLSKRLNDEGVQLRSIQDQIDTSTPLGTLFYHMMAALAQFESSLIGERTKAAMAAAKERGVRMGPKPTLTEAKIKMAIAMLKRGATAVEAGRRVGVSGARIRQVILERCGKPLWKARKRKHKRA